MADPIVFMLLGSAAYVAALMLTGSPPRALALVLSLVAMFVLAKIAGVL